MFERFTQSARDVVVVALRLAGDVRAREVREEHLALGVLDGDDTPGLRALAAAGCTAETRAVLVDELSLLSRRAGVTATDADALREIGIDVDGVLERMVEMSERPQARPRSSRLLGGRRVKGDAAARFSIGAERTLERTLREAIDLGSKQIHDGHVLLALLGGSGGAVAELWESHGLTYAGLRRALVTGAVG